MAAGEGPAKEPNRRVNMEAMVGNWLWRNENKKEKKAGGGGGGRRVGLPYNPLTFAAGAGGCDFRSSPDDAIGWRMLIKRSVYGVRGPLLRS